METGSKNLIQGGNNQTFDDRFVRKTNFAQIGSKAFEKPAGIKSKLSNLNPRDLNQSMSHPVLKDN